MADSRPFHKYGISLLFYKVIKIMKSFGHKFFSVPGAGRVTIVFCHCATGPKQFYFLKTNLLGGGTSFL
jgi:hypothetical protein